MISSFFENKKINALILLTGLVLFSAGLSGCNLSASTIIPYNYALFLYFSGNNAKAESAMNNLILNSRDTYPMWHIIRGNIRLRQNKNLAAINDYEKALGIVTVEREYETISLDNRIAHEGYCGIIEASVRAIYHGLLAKETSNQFYTALKQKFDNTIEQDNKLDVGKCDIIGGDSSTRALNFFKEHATDK